MESFKTFSEAADGIEPLSDPSRSARLDHTTNGTVKSAQGLHLSSDTSDDTAVLAPVTEEATDQASQPGPASPVYPQLSNNAVEQQVNGKDEPVYDEEEELDINRSFQRAPSPSLSDVHRNKDALVGDAVDEGAIRMHKFTLHETVNNYYILGTDLLDHHYRILKIDRTSDPGELNVTDDDVVYSKKEAYGIMNAVNEGNQATGGLKLKASFWGLLGFIKFTSQYYMIYVTKRSQVALVGGHYIYTIEKTEMISLTTYAASKIKSDRHIDEARYVNILNNLDLTKSFYFSYSYDCTRTLQHNIMREREALQDGLSEPAAWDQNSMFVWNDHLLSPARKAMKNPYNWCLSIIHGYVDQAALSVYWGRVVYVTLIARRSRYFAGARYLKRGANDEGHVANDVETEQIVSEMLTTSFHAPGEGLFANPNYTSYVQHRGSIPLHWLQDPSSVSPKPDIHLSVADPFFSATALHFDDMFGRYGTPIYCLNLIKQKERNPRETKLFSEYKTAIDYLNQFLPEDRKIMYRAWDMSRAQKSRDQDVIGTLDSIADDILPRTNFFRNGNDVESGLKLQNGVVRTNCIYCLDRTNAAQFVIAKKALGHQLQALGVIEDTSMQYDSDAISLFTHMWHDHGDTIAVQYGGSHLVNTMATYRKINAWQSQSRDMVESLRRYVNNSFMDSQRQEAYNLFLGTYTVASGRPMLWDMSSDYYLHHTDPRLMMGRRRASYRQWFTESNLREPSIPPSIWPQNFKNRPVQFFDDFWVEYYRPLALSTFNRLLSIKMHSNMRYIPIAQTTSGKYDLSPFTVRNAPEKDAANKEPTSRSKGVKIVVPSEATSVADTASIDARLALPTPEPAAKAPKPSTLGPWLDAQHQIHGSNHSRRYTGIIKETSFDNVAVSFPRVPKLPMGSHSFNSTPGAGTSTTDTGLTVKEQERLAKAELATQAFTSLVASSIHPTVKPAEENEYHLYITHPSSIPLVVDGFVDYTKAPSEFVEYISRSGQLSDRAVKQFTDVENEKYMNPVETSGIILDERAETSREGYEEFVDSAIRDEPLTVLEEDGGKKRYKAYRQWLRGKSLFKQRLIVGGEVV
ncbi:Polyphosphoinositide phosphatase [Cyphellophora attinorum]|uniref:Polyphosphoinositide phosphatase n=1 Tax=Cyphellophora attinorum TaxID=1664694 RepID=A0A0N1HSA0_9EURO|nr:Polyphosphoinositide phosphatase [Phialophora attinorum]KPI38974.1 Polyphosphoinositide phosphatase [Phialophora attinorum]